MGKDKKLLKGMKAITEALELLEDGLAERIQKSETQTFAMLDGRLARDLRAALTGQAELMAKVEQLELTQQMILDRLPDVSQLEVLRRRVRYLERVLEDHLAVHDDDPFEDFDPGELRDLPERREASRREPEPPPPDRGEPAGRNERFVRGESGRGERAGHASPPRFDKPVRFDRPNRSGPAS